MIHLLIYETKCTRSMDDSSISTSARVWQAHRNPICHPNLLSFNTPISIDLIFRIPPEDSIADSLFLCSGSQEHHPQLV